MRGRPKAWLCRICNIKHPTWQALAEHRLTLHNMLWKPLTKEHRPSQQAAEKVLPNPSARVIMTINKTTEANKMASKKAVTKQSKRQQANQDAAATKFPKTMKKLGYIKSEAKSDAAVRQHAQAGHTSPDAKRAINKVQSIADTIEIGGGLAVEIAPDMPIQAATKAAKARKFHAAMDDFKASIVMVPTTWTDTDAVQALNQSVERMAKQAQTEQPAAEVQAAAPAEVIPAEGSGPSMREQAEAKVAARDQARIGKSGIHYAGSRENDPTAYDNQGNLLCECGALVTSKNAQKQRARICGKCYSAHRKSQQPALAS